MVPEIEFEYTLDGMGRGVLVGWVEADRMANTHVAVKYGMSVAAGSKPRFGVGVGMDRGVGVRAAAAAAKNVPEVLDLAY